jgi:hypothetical protein
MQLLSFDLTVFENPVPTNNSVRSLIIEVTSFDCIMRLPDQSLLYVHRI